MAVIPGDRWTESTLALLREGYLFIPNRCRTYGSDLFETRLLLRRAICMSGAEAARLFYNPNRLVRRNAAPALLVKTLFGQGGVQSLDGQMHHTRKRMFMALMSRENVQRLAGLTADRWKERLAQWEKMGEVVLFHEVSEVLCAAVCEWAGVPVSASQLKGKTALLSALIEGPGAIGPGYLKGRWARKTSEQWIGGFIDAVRNEPVKEKGNDALMAIALHIDADGRQLDRHVAAVEVLNLLRPTVAIARYIVFTAMALHHYPRFRPAPDAQEADIENFVQEVRRFYPFFPFVAARVRRTFEWNGWRFPTGRRVLLDLYGTNHDTRTWNRPQHFDPRRFRQWNGDAFNFIPQGGADHYEGHRCAGEWITIQLMKTALRLLTGAMQYEVPLQDLSVDLSRMPAIPKSRFIIHRVRGANSQFKV